MKRVLTIAFKDLLITFRDPVGLILMLVAPLALTLVISAAFGGSDSDSAIGVIPIAVINQDTGEFGPYLVEAFGSDDLTDLVEVHEYSSIEAARTAVDEDQLASAILIPENFSASLLPYQGTSAAGFTGEMSGDSAVQTSQVEIYNNPSRSISTSIVRSIVETIIGQFISGSAAGQVAILQLLDSGRLTPQEALQEGEGIGRQVGENSLAGTLITLESSTYTPEGVQENEFSWLKYSAASMAILYLMFTMNASGRSILVEREGGTLTRMLIVPAQRATILGGKMLAGVLTGLIQMSILIVSSRFLFGFTWGDPAGVAFTTLAVVLAISGWGLIPAAFARTSGQANSAGTAITLTFAALAGNFVPRLAMPLWLQKISLVTPNAWGIETYYALIQGGSLTDALPAIGILFLMAILTFGIAIITFRRQFK